MKTMIAFLFLATGLFCQDTTQMPVPKSVLTLTGTNGTVEVKKNGTDTFLIAETGSELGSGDIIRTAMGGANAEVTFEDNTQIRLAEGSSAEITLTPENRSVTQKSGGIFCNVVPGGTPFIVHTPNATATIVGTDFAVRIKPDGAASFAVVKGKISIKGASGEEVAVKAGELCRAAVNAPLSAPEAIAPEILKKLEEWGGATYEPYTETAANDQAETSQGTVTASSATAVDEGDKATATGNAAPEATAPQTDATQSNADKTADEKKAEKGEEGGKKEGIQWSLGMGSTTVDGKQWSRLSLRPDIPLGPFGICLDLEIFIDDQGNISDKGWRFDDAKSAFESMQRKIYYIRYNHPGDPVYAKLGSLDNVTLGYGLIMYGYSNTLQYPDIRKMGLQFELNNISSLGFGVQAMVNNFQDFQKGGALVGTRLSVKPIAGLGLPILSNLIVGASYVRDMNQRAALSDRDGDKVPDALDKEPDDKEWAIVKPDFSALDTAGDPNLVNGIDTVTNRFQKLNEEQVNRYRAYTEGKDPFAMGGVDIGLPIISTKALSLIVYAQYAMTMDNAKTDIDPTKQKGWGLAAPGVGIGVGPLKVNVEYRHFKDQFQGEYFDQSYELDRMVRIDETTLASKENFLQDSVTLDGVFGRATLNIINLLEVGAKYQWMTIKDNHANTGNGPNADQTFGAHTAIGETIKNILRKAKIEDVMAYYEKKMIGTWQVNVKDDGVSPVYDKFFEKTPFVLMGYKVGFQIAASMILYWDTQYSYVLDETTPDKWDLKTEKRRNVEAVIKF